MLDEEREEDEGTVEMEQESDIVHSEGLSDKDDDGGIVKVQIFLLLK